jgi:predicted Na+-dependent transporter
MGLSLTIKQVFDPLRDVARVIKALLANFILVPLVGVLVKLIIPLDEPLAIGLILYGNSIGLEVQDT